MKLEYTTHEYAAELHRQSAEAQALVGDLDISAVNWRPDATSWSIAQCIEHLAGSNSYYLEAIQDAVKRNEDQIPPGQGIYRPAGWPSRKFIQSMEPPPTRRFRAFKKIVPASSYYECEKVLSRFLAAQGQLAEFAQKCREMDLGSIRFHNPFLRGIRFTVSSGLLIVGAHNRRHLWQAETVRKSMGISV
jgi:hypothetical protein